MNKTSLFFILYTILSISVIIVQLADLDVAQNILKPLLMPMLIMGYILLSKIKFVKYDYLIIGALFFSMLGDTFLMPLFNIFLAGLASFLIGHILYLTAFITDVKKPIKPNVKMIMLIIGGFVMYAIFFITIILKLISNTTPAFFIVAVIVYATILYSVFLVAVLRKSTKISSYNYIIIGASLFLISDGLLAYNKFIQAIPLSSIWVMSSYTSAQAFLMYGSLKRMG